MSDGILPRRKHERVHTLPGGLPRMQPKRVLIVRGRMGIESDRDRLVLPPARQPAMHAVGVLRRERMQAVSCVVYVVHRRIACAMLIMPVAIATPLRVVHTGMPGRVLRGVRPVSSVPENVLAMRSAR